MADNIIITNNAQQQRFETMIDGEVAFLEYRFHKADIALMHTLVPPSLEGRGIATALAKFAFNYAAEHQHPVLVYCPFVAVFLKRHPEYNSQVAKNHVG